MPRNAPGKKSVSVTMPLEAYESIKAWADQKEWSVAKASFKLIEMGLEQLTQSNKPLTERATASKAVSSPQETSEKKPNVYSLDELFALKRLGDLVQENYYKLQQESQIKHQRLQQLASGARSTEEERQAIKQVLGLDELPVDS